MGAIKGHACAVAVRVESIADARVGGECTVARGGTERGRLAPQADTHGEGTRALGGIGV